MKVVYDNVIFSLQKAGGISIYWKELISRLNQKDVIFFEENNNNIFRKSLDIFTQIESNISIKILRYLPFMKKLPKKSIFHSSYYRISLQKDIVNVTTVHDFTYEYFAVGWFKHLHILQKKIAIVKSDGIICVSENTKNDLLKFYPFIEKSKIKVIYNGVGEEFTKINNSNELLLGELEILKDKKYILYVGDRSNYKNFNILIELIKKINGYFLVIIGGQEFSFLENQSMKDIKNRIFHFRGLTGKELNIVYNNAFCLIYPSSYEGFGIPICEAMKAGCPVISVNVSSIPEVAGNAALLVDEINYENFISKISKLENNEFRNEIIKKGLLQSKKFNWDLCFNETYDFYIDLYNKKFKGLS